MASTTTYTSSEDLLKDYTVDLLDSNLYEIGQWTTEQLNEQLKIVYETKLADLTADERDTMITDLVSQINDQLDAVSDYADDLADQVEASQEAGELAQASSDQRLLTELQGFLGEDGANLSTLSTTIPTELYRLGGLVVESDQDEYFLYDQNESTLLMGGETVRYNLTAVSNESAMTAEAVNYADTDGDGVPMDYNQDGTADAQDLIDGAITPYALEGQDFYIELNPGDQIISAVYDKETKTISFEIETADSTITADDGSSMELTAKTFMLEVQVADLAASHIILQGDDYCISTDVFKDLDPEILAIMHDQDPTTNFNDTLFPDNATPELDSQLSALEGYNELTANFADAVSTLNAAFATNDNAFSFPGDPESILQEMAAAVFDNTLLNSLSENSYEDAAANFYAVLNGYSETEQAALVMAFSLAFIKKDQVAGTTQFNDLMGSEIYNMEEIIDVYADKEDSSIGAIEKAMHIAIEKAVGFGKYTDTSLGNILTSGLATATDIGVECAWKDNAENIAALQFCIDNGFDTDGAMNTAKTYEQSLVDGEISADASMSIQQTLSSNVSDDTYYQGLDLTQEKWMNALNYLKNNLFKDDGSLVDDPLQVFKNCMKNYFDSGDSFAADDFACSFLALCSNNSTLAINTTLMQGSAGKDIANYLWNIADNGWSDPPCYEVAKTYKNSL